MPVPGCSIYLPPKLTLEGTRVLMQEFLSFFSRSFLTLPCPGAWEGRSAWSQTGVLLFGSLCCTVPLNLFVDCPACPCGLLTASNLSLSPNSRPGTTSRLEPTSSRIPGRQVYALQFKWVTNNSSLWPCRWSGQDLQPTGRSGPSFLLLEASKFIFWGCVCGDTCSLISTQRSFEGHPKWTPWFYPPHLPPLSVKINASQPGR